MYFCTLFWKGMDLINVSSALISVYDKTGLDVLIRELADHHVTIYSTGGTQKFIEDLGSYNPHTAAFS